MYGARVSHLGFRFRLPNSRAFQVISLLYNLAGKRIMLFDQTREPTGAELPPNKCDSGVLFKTARYVMRHSKVMGAGIDSIAFARMLNCLTLLMPAVPRALS